MLLSLFDGNKKEQTLRLCDKTWKIRNIETSEGGYVAIEVVKPMPIKGTKPADKLEYYKNWWRENNPYMLDEAPEIPDYTKPKHFGDVS
jgi:hypothetical protein